MSDIVKRFETRLDQPTLDNLELLNEKFQKEKVWQIASASEEKIQYNKTIVHVLNNYMSVEQERNDLRIQVSNLKKALVKGLEAERNKQQFFQFANEALNIKENSH